jgi:hypothetical protein
MRPSSTPTPQPAPTQHSTTAVTPDATPTVIETPAVRHSADLMGPLQPGISYNQGDLYDRPASSPQQCSQLCYNDDRCRAVTFVISQQRCWIKDRVNPTSSSPDMISALKQSQ